MQLSKAALEPDFLFDLAQHGHLRVLAPLEKTRDEPVPRRGPADAAHEDYVARTLDDGRDDRHRVAPMHERALRAHEACLAAAHARS